MIHLALWILSVWFLLWFFFRIVIPFALACLAMLFMAWDCLVKKWWKLSTRERFVFVCGMMIVTYLAVWSFLMPARTGHATPAWIQPLWLTGAVWLFRDVLKRMG